MITPDLPKKHPILDPSYTPYTAREPFITEIFLKGAATTLWPRLLFQRRIGVSELLQFSGSSFFGKILKS